MGNTRDNEGKKQKKGERRNDYGSEKTIKDRQDGKRSEELIVSEIEIGGAIWRIASIYDRNGKKKTLEQIEELLEETRTRKIIVAGDFNARTAEKGDIP